MTKAQLIEAIRDLPDDAEILIANWPDGLDYITGIELSPQDGPGAPPFAVINHALN